MRRIHCLGPTLLALVLLLAAIGGARSQPADETPPSPHARAGHCPGQNFGSNLQGEAVINRVTVGEAHCTVTQPGAVAIQNFGISVQGADGQTAQPIPAPQPPTPSRLGSPADRDRWSLRGPIGMLPRDDTGSRVRPSGSAAKVCQREWEQGRRGRNAVIGQGGCITIGPGGGSTCGQVFGRPTLPFPSNIGVEVR